MNKKALRLRFLSQVLLALLAGCALLEAIVGSWLWAAMLTVFFVMNVVSYRKVRRLEDQFMEIEAHHEWLRWKANQQ